MLTWGFFLKKFCLYISKFNEGLPNIFLYVLVLVYLTFYGVFFPFWFNVGGLNLLLLLLNFVIYIWCFLSKRFYILGKSISLYIIAEQCSYKLLFIKLNTFNLPLWTVQSKWCESYLTEFKDRYIIKLLNYILEHIYFRPSYP